MSMACNFIEKISDIDNEYRPVPFWFINHYIREDVLRHQIDEMHEKGFGGIMFHGRDGLRSRYLEREWEDGITWAIDQSKKNGMDVWLYDENHYPSGIAGNAVFKKYPEKVMMSLAVLHEENVAASHEFKYIIPKGIHIKFSLAFSADGSTCPIVCNQGANKICWTNDSGQTMTVLLLHIKCDLPLPNQNFPFYPDYLDPEMCREFIDLTYQWYVDRFKADMGRTIKGIFTDNSCYNFGITRRSIAWTPKLPERLKAETGFEIENILPAIFCRTDGFEEVRQVFWRFLGDEYLRTFVYPIQNICEQNNVAATGHYCIEDGCSEHIRQIGDRYDLKRGQTLAGVDMLGRKIGEDLFKNGHHICASMRVTADAAYYNNGSRVMCECLGLMGGWKLDLGEIKRVTGFLAAQGIDFFVPHGLYYSIAGTRKWECIPDHYHNPMWNYYREWTDWISKISFLLSYSERAGKVALLHPSTTLRSYIELGIESGPDSISDHGAECDLSDATFRMLVNGFVRNNIEFDIIDEYILQHAEVKGNNLLIKAGNGCVSELSVILLPACRVLNTESMTVLEQFSENGGKVISVNNRVESIFNGQTKTISALSANPFSKELYFTVSVDGVGQLTKVIDAVCENVRQRVRISSEARDIISRVWKKWGHDFFMLHNAAPESVDDVHVELSCEQELFVLDLNDNSLTEIGKFTGNKCEFIYNFSPGETVILVAGKDLPISERCAGKWSQDVVTIPIAGDWEFSILEDNMLPLREGIIKSCDMRQMHTYRFNVRDIPEQLTMIIDREMTKSELLFNQYSSELNCCINSQPINNFKPGTHIDYFMFEADITHLVHIGENEFSIEYPSELLERDRMFHSPFVAGDFRLIDDKESFAIACPDKIISAGDWCKQGYPFYAGAASYKKSITMPGKAGDKIVLSLGNIANAAEVLINQKSIGRRVLPPWDFDISDYRNEGTLDIEVRVINTPQNMFCNERMVSGLLGPVEIKLYKIKEKCYEERYTGRS